MARLSVHPLDRTRPLWELHLIHGLADGKVAIMTKFHHAAVDGVSGAELMSVLFDGTPEGRKIAATPPLKSEGLPSQPMMLARGITSMVKQPFKALAAAEQTTVNLDHLATARSIPGAREVGMLARKVRSGNPFKSDILDAPSMKAPRMSFNAPVSKKRSFSMVTLPLDAVKELKDAHGATVNDVVVAMCTGALRRWLSDKNELPDTPLIAAVPVSVRTKEQQGTFGNRVGNMVVPIPTNEPDPTRRLDLCHKELSIAKERHHAVPASLLSDSTDLIPPAMFTQTVRTITRVAATEGMAPIANLVISNVPGSRSPLYCAGAKILEHYPVSVLGDSLGLNITVFSYLDQLCFGLLADPKIVSNLDGLGSALREELTILEAAPTPDLDTEGELE